MMVRICPKPCGRLATAAILIIIGVIQFLVGVILLRSEYANLLSGPDFMTASSNIAVGSVYGITASIWKVSIKRKSMKNNARTNVLAALLLSVITINATTLIVLITGEGHKLLALHLENNRLGIVDFADEILAYAFVTSVCLPITCIVVALVSFSGRCLEMYRDRKTAKQEKKITKEDRYKWTFDIKKRDGSTSKTPSSVSESLSTSDDSVFSEKEDSCSRLESALSVDSIPSPLGMWTQTREIILSADLLSPQQSPFAFQNKFQSSPYEKFIPRIKESSLVKPPPGDLTKTTSLCYTNTNPPNICSSILKRSASNPAPDVEVFLSDLVDKQFFCIKKEISEEKVTGRSKLPARNDNNGDANYQINEISEYLRAETLVSPNRKIIGYHEKSGQTLNPVEASKKEIIHSVDPIVSELKAEILEEFKQKVQNIVPGASVPLAKLPNDSKGIKEAPGPGDPFRVPVVDTGPRKNSRNSNVILYEINSGLDENVLSRRPLLTNESRTSIRLPTKTTTNSSHPVIANKTTNASSSAIGRLRSKSVDFSRNDSRAKKKYNIPEVVNWRMETEGKTMKRQLGSPKANSLKQNRWPDSSIKMSMAAIAEMPSEEDTYNSSLHDTAFIAPKSRRKSHIIDENSNIEVRMSPSSRLISSVRNAQRKSSVSTNSLLKRMWSSAASIEPKVNVADLIVDEDSLIGLSDEELLARTYRIRSLRKSVEHRLKQKAEAGK